jgi:hypothetical protein
MRGEAALLVVLAAMGLGGCSVTYPNEAAAKLPLVRRLEQQGLAVTPPPGIRVAPADFATAVRAFGRALKPWVPNPVPPGDDDLYWLLIHFSTALERVPGGDFAGAGLAAEQMRAQARAMQGAGPRNSPPVRNALEAGLSIGAGTLVAIARSPAYAGLPELPALADDLEDALAAMQDDPAPVEPIQAVGLLRRAELVLVAMLEAQEF